MTLRSILLVSLALATTQPARSEGSSDLEREIALARTTWPRDLEALRFASPTDKLVAWVPPDGAIQVWSFSPTHDCRPIELRRRTAFRNNGEPLVGKEILETKLRNGKEYRLYRIFWIGTQFTGDGDQLGWEERDAQGAWQATTSEGRLAAAPDPRSAI